MAKIWDDDESVSEYEMIAEDAQKAEELAEEYASKPQIIEADEEQLEEFAEESAFELTSNESNVIYNARLRLEQAKLYELLINHNLFEGVEASEQAIKNVQNELKFYVVKRLEILLGIREPVVRIETAQAEPQFNDIEADFLKQLAYKGTFGQSQESSGPVKIAPKTMTLKPVTPAQKLKAMTTPKKVEVKQEVHAPQKVAPPPLPQLVKRPVAPPVQQRTATPQQAPPAKKPTSAAKPKVRPSGMGRDLSKDEIEALARAELAKPASKPFHELNAKEKAKKIAEVNARNPRKSAPGAQPMPSADQIKMKYLTQQESKAYSKDQTSQFNSILAASLAAKKNTGDYDGE